MQCPESGADYPMRIREIKRLFTAEYKQRFGLPIVENASRRAKNEAAIWQRRYWEHTVRDEEDLHTHLDYIHYNPVKHSWVEHVRDWAWSSFHRYVRMGFYDEGWGSGCNEKGFTSDFGE
jgi:putative transposase